MPDPTIPELAAWCRRKSADLLTGGSTTDGMNLRAIAAALERMQWRPIAEAPKDGRPCLLFRPPARFGEWDQRVTAIWHAKEKAWIWPTRQANDGWWDDGDEIARMIDEDDFFLDGDTFTHFVPLPPPPAEKEPDR